MWMFKFIFYLCLIPFSLICMAFSFFFFVVQMIFSFLSWLLDLIYKSKVKKKYYSIDYIDELSGIDFEYFVALNLLPNMGFYNIEKTQDSVDFGVDVIGYKDGEKYAIQCKRFSKPVGIKAVQEVIGGKVYYNCSKCMVISNNTFTPSAIKLLLFGRYDIEKVELINLPEDIEELAIYYMLYILYK